MEFGPVSPCERMVLRWAQPQDSRVRHLSLLVPPCEYEDNEALIEHTSQTERRLINTLEPLDCAQRIAASAGALAGLFCPAQRARPALRRKQTKAAN